MRHDALPVHLCDTASDAINLAIVSELMRDALQADRPAMPPTIPDAVLLSELFNRLLETNAEALGDILPSLSRDLTSGISDEAMQALLVSLARHVDWHRQHAANQLLGDDADPVAIAQSITGIAEAAIALFGALVSARFAQRHGRVPDSELLVVGLGRLGGGTLTPQSDLDLVYLFTGDHAALSDGPRPLDAVEYYARLAARLSSALATPTLIGPLFEVDSRLRPWGTKGTLASSLSCYRRYYTQSAWTWEHMALTRARPLFGSTEGRDAAQSVINDCLYQTRDAGRLTEDAIKMRGRIRQHKPPSGPFDVKLIDGGLVDAEFVIQVHQLRSHIGLAPSIAVAATTLAEAGLVGRAFVPAVDLLGRMLIAMRVLSASSSMPPLSGWPLVAQVCGYANWPTMLDAYADARATVTSEWKRIADSKDEAITVG